MNTGCEPLQNCLRLLLLAGLCGLLTFPADAQLNIERTAFNRLQSGKWESSLRLLKKSLRKDSTNLEANFVITCWFLAPGNPENQVDSSRKYVLKSERIFDQLTSRERDRVQKFPIDSLLLFSLHQQIDSTAFERAKRINTEAAYNYFITSFSAANQRNYAIELRDEVSFLEALKINTPQSFKDYLARYPQSHRALDATARYERLLFDEKTKDKSLGSYKIFLKNYPESPYSGIAQKEIFERTTATGEPEAFFLYLHEYPQGQHAKISKDILYYLFKESEERIPASIQSDSLNLAIQLGEKYWIPFYKNALFGFMDQEGQEVLAPQYDEIESAYKCEPIKDDILFLKSGVYSRSGKKLAVPGTKITPIGIGFLKSERNGCFQLIHKSGVMIIGSCHEDYKLVGNNFVAAKTKEDWQLFTLTGRLIDMPGIQEVKELEGVVVITRLGKKILATVPQVAELINEQELKTELVFDDVLALDKNLLLVRNGSLEGVINSQLQFTIPLDRHSLTKTSFGLIEKKSTGSRVRGLSAELEDQLWQEVKYHRDWLVLSSLGNLQLFNISTRKMMVTKADSIWFDHSLAFVQNDNALKAYISANHAIDLQPDSKIRFINAPDSVQFFFTESKSKRTVFDLISGDQLFVTEFEFIESIGNDLFVVAKGNKKGIVGRTGKVVVPIEMDAIVRNQGQLSLLQNRKFGLFDLASRKFIKPIYERNVSLLNSKYLVAFKNGFYGLINWDTKPVTEFEFSEVVSWSESTVWVKKNMQWMLLNYITKEVIIDRIRDFSWIRKSVEENIVRVHRENYYGVISNRKGLIIAPTFHDIVNLGTAELPFYFTEKIVEEAEIYVVLYYNKDGKLVRRQAYEEDEYEQIYCDSN